MCSGIIKAGLSNFVTAKASPIGFPWAGSKWIPQTLKKPFLECGQSARGDAGREFSVSMLEIL